MTRLPVQRGAASRGVVVTLIALVVGVSTRAVAAEGAAAEAPTAKARVPVAAHAAMPGVGASERTSARAGAGVAGSGEASTARDGAGIEGSGEASTARDGTGVAGSDEAPRARGVAGSGDASTERGGAGSGETSTVRDGAGDAGAPDPSVAESVAGAPVPELIRDAGAADVTVADAGAPDAGPPGWAVDITPVAAPAYTPELGFLFAAGGVLSWNGDPSRADVPRSSATLVTGVGTVGAFLAQLRTSSFWRGDVVRATLNVDVRDMPDHYFGVGFDNGLTRPQGEDTTAYRRTWWQATPTFLFRVKGPLFIGTVFDFTGTLTRDESAGVRADPDFQQGGSRLVSSGWGATLSIDTRDVPINAFRGVYFAASWVAYLPWAGANTTWQAATLDYRQYVTLGRPGSTLAWQVKYRTAWGEVPWSDLSQLGTPWDLRAYRWGRYRDRTALSAVVEYRFMLPFASTSFFSRFGLAGWLGLGALGSTALPDFRQLLPAAGVGVRFDVQKRITLRLDLGFGRESRAFYFNFLEAF